MHKAACRLPKTPSALIRVAIDDLKKAERSKEYGIDMGKWHAAARPPAYDTQTCSTTGPSAPCYVCLAGSVMAFTLNAPTTYRLVPGDFPQKVENALYALNEFRVGDVAEGLFKLGIVPPKVKRTMKALGIDKGTDKAPRGWLPMPEYANAPAKFKREMLALADKLEAVGL